MATDFPLRLQQSWLKDEYTRVMAAVPKGKQFTSPTIQKNFTRFARIPPLLFIIRFAKVTSANALIVLLSDSVHMVYGVIPYETIKAFELKHSRRVTYEMAGTSILLNNADMEFASVASPDWQGVFREGQRDVVVLRIRAFEVFQRDQVELSHLATKNFKFLQDEIA